MKKIATVILCFSLLALCLTACGAQGPDKALGEKLAMLKEGNFEQAELLEGSAFANEDTAMLTALYSKMDYTVGKAVENGDTATVEATVTMVDMSAALAAYMQEALAHMLEEDWDADGSRFTEIVSAEDAATKEFSVTVQMVKTEETWEIAEEGNDALMNALTGGLFSALDGLGDILG